MGVLSCVACRKVIDAEPPRCPACGAAQEDADRGRSARLLQRAGAFAVLLAAGSAVGYKAAAPSRRPMGVYPIKMIGHAAPRADREELSRRAVNEWAKRLKSDAAHPFATLEDVAVEPERHAGRAGSTLAMVFQFDPRRRRVTLQTGWGTGTRLEADARALSPEEQKTMLRLCSGPSWSVFKGHWRPEGGSLVLAVEEFQVVQADAGAKTLSELLE